MRAHIGSSIIAGVAVVGTFALVPVAPPPTQPQAGPTVVREVREVRLTAAPALGAIPLAFIRNQFEYCSVICPHVVQGAITVPIAAAQTPLTFLSALASTGSLLKAVGTAAASVTGPANAAATPIIENDVFRVVPKAFNNLEVAVVELFNVGSAVFQPGEFLQAVITARERILAALNQPLPPPVPTETGARTLPQVVAVEAIKVFTAVAFQAGELVLLGVVQTADAVAQELAQSGDPGAALVAGVKQANQTIATAGGIVVDAVDTAVTNIRDSLNDPFPSTTKTSAPPADDTSTRDVSKKTDTRETQKLSESSSDTKDEPREPKKDAEDRSEKPERHDNKKADARASD